MAGEPLARRVVVVTRPTELELLLDRHVTRGQVEFALRARDRSLADVDSWHARQHAARQAVLSAIPVAWRRSTVDRADLDRVLFEPDDLVVAVGQDGLVANLAKYLDGQPVIGVNPDPERNPGVLVRHAPAAVGALLAAAHAGAAPTVGRTMVEVTLDDGRAPARPERGLRRPPQPPVGPLRPGVPRRHGAPGLVGADRGQRDRRNGLGDDALTLSSEMDGGVASETASKPTPSRSSGAPGWSCARRRPPSPWSRTRGRFRADRTVPTLEHPMRSQSLEELRERALELMQARPAETTPEATWLVGELERHKDVLLGLIDYLLTEEREPE